MRPEGESEAVLADMRAGMNDHPVADQRRGDRRRGANRAVAAEADVGADDRICADNRAGADLGATADHGAGIDDHAGLEPRRGMDEGRRRNAGLAEDRTGLDRARIEPRHHHRHRAIGFARHEHSAARGRCVGVARRDERRRSPRRLERVEVPRVVEEGQIAGTRLIESGDVVDRAAGVCLRRQGCAAPDSDFGERRLIARRKEANLGQRRSSVRCDNGRAGLWRARFNESRPVEPRRSSRPRTRKSESGRIYPSKPAPRNRNGSVPSARPRSSLRPPRRGSGSDPRRRRSSAG